jgi:hypothetical protein
MLTFREFIHICEGKKAPPGAVKGTYKEKDGVKTYTLAPYEGPSGPLGSEKKVMKTLDKQGGIGGGAIKKAKKKAKKIEKIEEQDPHMTPTTFNVVKAREQAKGGIQHRKHVHGELAREAGAQQAAKQARIKAIMSR